MERNITEIVEKWVIVKLFDDYYRVFGTWSGGYLGCDRWKLNSGIEKVEQDEEYYYFIGFSGSCYKCHKKSYGVITSYGVNKLNQIVNNANGKIELMKDVDDWSKLI